jgi:hypothetical protein
MAGRLVMSGDIGGWFCELAAEEPARARAAAAALVAVLDAPDPASAPSVTGLPVSADLDDGRAGLDYSYQEMLEQLQEVRREVATVATALRSVDLAIEELAGDAGQPDVAERLAKLRRQRQALADREASLAGSSQGLQAEVDKFRTLKESVKAGYTAAEASVRIRESLGDSAAELGLAQADLDAARARLAQTVSSARDLLLRISGLRGPADGLLELRVGGFGDDEVRFLLAEQPAGAMIVLAVLHGDEAIRAQRSKAIALASDLLDSVRSGSEPGPDGPEQLEFPDAAAFLATFFSDSTEAIKTQAEALAACITLPQLRERFGIGAEDMAERMRMSPARLREFELASLADQEPAQLSRYISALGGDLSQVAVINGVRFELR